MGTKIYHGKGELELKVKNRKKGKQWFTLPFRRHVQLIVLPEKFKKLLTKKMLMYGVDKIDFTYGYETESNIHSIAIVHPLIDYFKRETGYKIVNGRIRRMRGEIPGRQPYKEIPKYIEVSE